VTGADAGAGVSLAASGAFFLLAAGAALTRRSQRAPQLAATSDLGPETPAVANLLVNGGRLTPDAVPATLLDLAARHVVKIEEGAPGSYGCRLAAEAPADLTAYERRVLELLRSKAVDGLVPAQALTSGPTEAAKAWLNGFRKEVVAQADRAGLCRPRWPAALQVTLAGLALAALVLAAYSADEEASSLIQYLAIGVSLAGLWVLTKAFGDDSQLITAAGAASEGRWVALRKYLHADEIFGTLPPTAVAVRDRYLAYGAALGAAAAAVRAVPMGAESDRWAWSRYGGTWRQVRVSYPRRWPPGWGRTPGQLFQSGLKWGVFGGFWLWLGTRLMPLLQAGAVADQGTRILRLAGLLLTLIALPVLAAGAWMLLAAVMAVLPGRRVTGEAIRLRRFGDVCYLAVYTGAGDHVRAWVVSPQLYAGLTEYEPVTVSVSPLVGHVHSAHVQGQELSGTVKA
jgi:hypothetical protein